MKIGLGTIFLVGLMCFALCGCGNGGLVGSKYVAEGEGVTKGLAKVTIEFKSEDKAYFTSDVLGMTGQTTEVDYKMDGDKIIINVPNQGNMVLTLNKEAGTITGMPDIIGRLKKVEAPAQPKKISKLPGSTYKSTMNNQTVFLEFKSDNKVIATSSREPNPKEMTYKIEGGSVTITEPGKSNPVVLVHDADNILTLTQNGQEIKFKKLTKEEEEEAKALRAKEEALRKQQLEREEAKRKAEAEAKARDENEWAKAQQAGTDEAYRIYANNNPQGGHVAEANQIIDNIAWESAKKENSIESYNKYLDSSTKGQHHAEAAQMAADLRDHVSKLSDVPELSWNMVLGLQAKTFFADKPIPPSMRDAYIAVNDCESWKNAQNEIQKVYIQDKAQTNVIKGDFPSRVRFSGMMVLNAYDYAKQAFVIGSCGYSDGGMDLNRKIVTTFLVQPPSACSNMMSAGVPADLTLEIERPLPNLSFLPLEPRKAEILLDKLKISKKLCNSSNTLADVFVEFVANVKPVFRGTGYYRAMSASLIAAYVWTDPKKTELIGILGNASSDSALYLESDGSARNKVQAPPIASEQSKLSYFSTVSAQSAPPTSSVPPPVSSTAITQQGAPSQTSFNKIDSVVHDYFGFVQAKQVEKALMAYSSSKRPNLKRNLLESVARETEYYRIERIEPRKIEPSYAKVLVYAYHKKTKSPEEYWQIEMDLINEQGEWKILSTPGTRLK